jgi:hypothetical protein
MASQSDRTFEIVDGPSKFALMLSLFEGRNFTNSVDFSIKEVNNKYAPMVAIVEITKEQGGDLGYLCDFWRFTGYICSSEEEKRYSVLGRYSTQTRKGFLQIIGEVPGTDENMNPGDFFSFLYGLRMHSHS